MSRAKCDILRERAMQHGQDSALFAAWRRHARECEDCATEIHLLDILDHQADSERLHLPRRNSAMLIEMVRQQYQRPQRPSWMACIWPYLWKPAILVALVFALVQVTPQEWPEATAGADDVAVDANAAVTALAADDGCYFIPLQAGAHELEQAVLTATSPAEAVCLPEVLPGRSVDRAIRQLRERIHVQHCELENLIDRDLSAY
ncbi:MAG: hypothetical protein GX937_13660 [Lentisphaerae bacterium]|jgi:hypothetical protein|nr:hypothetical protein [Lentisphaerota bacterium]